MKKFLFTKQTWYLESNISEAFIPPGDDHVVFFLAQPSFLVDPSPVHVSSRYQNYRACPRAFQLILFFLVDPWHVHNLQRVNLLFSATTLLSFST